MNKKEESVSCSEKLYIDPERYRAQKEIMKGRGIDCRDKTIMEKAEIYASLRQFQNYISGSRPVPEDRLLGICRYLDTSPEWLTGQTDDYFVSFEASTPERRAFNLAFEKDRCLIGYLAAAGITERGNAGAAFFGVDLSPREYRLLLDNLEAAIDFTARTFVDNITALRS